VLTYCINLKDDPFLQDKMKAST